MGIFSGYNNTSGLYNIYIGFQSAYKLGITATGSYNVFMGYQTGINNTASNNLFIGYQSGYSNTSGTQLTYLGYQAGRGNVKGINNSYFGYQAGYSGTTVVSSITITNGGTGYTAGNLIVDNTGTGAENTADITMVYAESAEKAPEFVQMQPNSSDQRFRDLRLSITSTIMQVHKFTSAIVGIVTGKQIGRAHV